MVHNANPGNWPAAQDAVRKLAQADGRVILDALRARARAGAAVVVVSHRPDAADGADAVYRMQAGRLALGKEGNP